MRPSHRVHPFRPLTWLVTLSLGGLGGGLLLLLALVAVLFGLASVLAPLADGPGTAHVPQSSWRPGVPAQDPAGLFSNGFVPLQVTHAWQGPENQAVVNDALYVAAGLYDGPPDGLDTWYVPARIPQAIAYWQQTCPGCAAWAQGNLQCVMLLTAAYGLAGQPLPYIGNAVTFWTSGAYAHQPGWAMLPASALPYPGDIVVLDSPYFGGVGHVVILVDVKLPAGPGRSGYVQFAEANGPGSIDQMPLEEDAFGHFAIAVWRNYTVLGLIRHVSALTLPSLANG